MHVELLTEKQVEPERPKRTSMRWSDIDDRDEVDALPLWPVVAAVKSRDGEIGWAWDAASATNSDVEEAERRRNYPMSEPPRIRPRRRDPPRQDRQTRVRHHTKKEVQLPPRPQRPQPTEAPPEDEMIRTRHLQEVERDHLPTRFHREDQRQALSKEMQEGAQQMFDGWGNQKRMSTVMAAMEELPKRVGEDMHKLASHVVDSVQSEINEVSTVIRGESVSTQTTKAMKHLEVIPTMVLNLLESRMEKAKAQVRERVGGMIEQLSAIKEEDEGGEELAEQMQDMSSEVVKIAGDAVEAAAQECRAHATQQLDIALASLREPLEVEEAQDDVASKWKKVCKIRNAAEDDLLLQKNVETSIFPAATRNAMDTAMAVIKDKDFVPHSVTNEVVADQLLRAKVRGRGDVRAPSSINSGEPREKPQPTNPGSFGHPDLCPRPCIYYRSGSCSSGAACAFCHMPHSRRPLRLDKRHREALKRMPFKKLLKVVVPIVAAKVLALADNRLTALCEVEEPEEAAVAPLPELMGGMTEIKTDVLAILEVLARNAGLGQLSSDLGSSARSSRWLSGVSTASTGSSSSEHDSHYDKKVWLRALQVMNLRSLLVMVRRLARDAGDAEDLQLVEQIIQRIQEALGKSAPDFEEDEPDRVNEPIVALSSTSGNQHVPQMPVQLQLSQLVSQ